MRYIALVAVTISSMSTMASAEVCDKEVPRWSQGDGPVNDLDYIINAALSPFGLIVIALLVLSTTLLRHRLWPTLLGAACTGFSLFALSSLWLSADYIYMSSIAEGCRASPFGLMFVLSLLLALFAALAVRRVFAM